MGNQFDVAAGARLESTGRAPSNDEIVPRFSLDDINQAFDNNEFCFYLQPKCNAENHCTNHTVGCDKVNCGKAAREGALRYDLGTPFVNSSALAEP